MSDDVTIKITYDTGEQQFSELDFYHGAKSLAALSEAFIIATNAAINQEPITKTTAAKGFRAALRKSFINSYTQTIILTFQNATTLAAYKRLSFEGYVDFLRIAFGSAIGKDLEPQKRGSKRLIKEFEDIEWLTERIENIMHDLHSPIKYQGLSIKLAVGARTIETFNKQTLKYIEDEVKSKKVEEIIVGVSKFNGRTGTGRFIYEMEGESIPFYPVKQKITQEMMTYLSRSLDQFTNGEFEQLKASVITIHTGDGRLKRFILHGVQPIQ